MAEQRSAGAGRLLLRAGVVLVSALLAMAGLVGLFGWVALHTSWALPAPEELTGPTEILARDGTVLARFDSEVDRRVVSLEEVSEHARNAVVASEDERFYRHQGVDVLSLLRAVATNVRTGGITQGGSTLTQQYVKNAFVGSDRTLLRKVREAVISIQLERDMTKEDILESYLNRVYFGEGAYGIEAAALTYFDDSAGDLGPAEAATLAQLLPAPSRWNPRADPAGARERRDSVLDTMVRLDMLPEAEAERAKSTPVEVEPRRREQVFHAPYFVAHVRRQLEHVYGTQELLTGALTVRTTLDLEAHRQLRQAVADQLPPQEGANADVDAGAAAVDPRTGDILALYGGRSFRTEQLNLATQLHRRQPGSGFKPFVYVAALEQGMAPSDVYPAPASVRPTDCPPGPNGETFTEPVHNAGGSGYGQLPLREALARSVNTVFVQLGCDVGPASIVETARRMGVRNVLEPFPNISIGGAPSGPSPLDMASAFGTLANDGLSCPARSIVSVTERDGGEREPPAGITTAVGMPVQPRALTPEELAGRPEGLAEQDRGRCRQVIDRNIARHTTEALERVVAETTGRRAQIDRPQAGKTGTTDDEVDAWFNGYTPDLAMSVWVGHTTDDTPLRNVAGFSRVQGGTVPALIWRDAAAAMLADVPPGDFLEPGELRAEETLVGPPRPRPRPVPSPSPSPSPTPAPTAPETPTPDGEPTPGEPPDDEDDPGEDSCIPILEDCGV